MEEDIILPDDFEATPSVETQGEQQVTSDAEPTVEDTTPTDEQSEPTEPVQDSPKLKLKYNSEDREVSLEEAKILAQKGLNYEKAIERAQQEATQRARDSWIAEQGYTWNDRPITNEAEYKQALAEQDLVNKYRDRDLPEEVIQELVESRRDREERNREKQQNEVKAKEDANLQEFLQYFKDTNDRDFDTAKDSIPAEVWEVTNRGVPLKYAYMEHHAKELSTTVKVLKQNESNKQKAPIGSITAHGSNEVASEDDFEKGFNSVF